MRPMQIKLLYFLILITTNPSRHVASHEATEDLDKNESQIEILPLEIVPPAPSILETPETVKENTLALVTEHLHSPETFNEDATAENDTGEAQTMSSNNSENRMIPVPVFSEWTQQQMEEEEKKLVELTNSSEPNKDVKNETLVKHQIVKMRQKNYASPDCGAKVLASNPEAQSTSSVLTYSKDEYLLSPCTDRIWFVVELCDSIQAQRVELANFELFSSPLKTVSISVSNRFPTREWTTAAQFEAKSERDVQVFDLTSTLFGKFVRVDLTYTNTEHYCPLSFFRVFGTSEIEAFEVENEVANPLVDDDDEIEQEKVQRPKENLLNRAGAAVLSIVQKAAEALVKVNGKVNETASKTFQSGCVTLSHEILCQTCSSEERNELEKLISCKNAALTSLLDAGMKNFLLNSDFCHAILGFDLQSNEFATNKDFITSILPHKYIAALCNFIAKDQNSLTLRVEDIPGINASLIMKKDEVSLKNVSKKLEEPLCKHEEEAPAVAVNITETIPGTVEVTEGEQKNNSRTGDELNIFNVVAQQENEPSQPPTAPETVQDEVKEVKQNEPATVEEVEQVSNEPSEVKIAPVEIKTPPSEIKPEVKPPTTPEVVKPPPEHFEVKINGDVRSSNPPESVFLRLSNRIKTLEKNMTLSTQYLEELSRRYKMQIEDLQQSFLKLQSSVDDQNQKKILSDKKNFEDKRILRESVVDLDNKVEFMVVILIVLSVFFMVQTVLVIALFKRISDLRIAFAAQQEAIKLSPPVSPSEKTNRAGRKRSKQRMRKISAPNILTQKSPVKSPEFPQQPPILSRTVSAPNKVNGSIIPPPPAPSPENIGNMQAMLEENDEILIPGFEDLKLNDDDVSLQSQELDGLSTASAQSSEKQRSKSFKFKRRLSSPFQLNKSSTKATSERTNEKAREKKAMSESPQSRAQKDSLEIQKSKSFQGGDDDGSVKFKKSNSFKKLFKKLF